MKNWNKIIYFLGISLFCIGCKSASKTEYEAITKEQKLTDYVNPFIGTTNDGNTHPGANLPWGMVASVPHTKNFRKRANHPAVYSFGDSLIYGFGSVNPSGLGCPIGGSVPLKVSTGEFNWDIESFQSTYSQEVAKPAYYSVHLDKHNIEAQMTATQRSTRFRFIPKKQTGLLNIFLDMGANMSHEKGGIINIHPDGIITGIQNDGTFCGVEKGTKIYFAMEVQNSYKERLVFEDKKQVHQPTAKGVNSGIALVYNIENNDNFEVKIGVSFVSEENAILNLNEEQGELSFEEIQKRGEDEWNKQLSKVSIEGGTTDEQTVFYTALYHSLLLPHVISDVNGEYYSRDADIVYDTHDYTRYSTYSLWDTYRSLHPLLSLLYPKQERDMVVSLIEMYKEWGWLPKWELYGYDTYVMVGDPALPVITDTYLKGITDFDADLALVAMQKSASETDNNPIRPGNKNYLELGYLPIDDRGGNPKDFNFLNGIVWGPVSTTLEYNFADYNIAQLAKALGKEDLYHKYYHQSHSFTNLYDKETTFFRPKKKNGEWMENFNPLDRHFDVNWEASGGKGFVEGNAWQYNFFTPHAIDSLKRLMGEEVFADKLEQLFDKKQYDLTNEPDITFPYLFNYIDGKQHFTQKYVREESDKNFTNTPAGIPGNDDAGTLSAWLVFSQLGIFPDAPGIPVYQLTTPKFDKVTLNLDTYVYDGKKVELSKTNKEGLYFNEVKKGDNTKIKNFRISHEELVNSKSLIFDTNVSPVL